MEKNRYYKLILLAILVLAVFLRFWQLSSIPPGLYPDVAMNGNDALGALKSGDFKLFYPENNGREGLFINLIALSFLIFGPSIWAIKIVAAIIGILTVFGFYLLVKELFQLINTRYQILDTRYSLLATFLFATSFWHLNFSRFGFRAIMVPFILVWAFYLLFLGLRQKKLWPVIIAGAVFGLGFHTYIAFRVASLILPFLLIPYWLSYRKENLQKKYLLLVIGYLLSVFIIALPIGLYFLTNPQDFIGRATGVSIFAAVNPLKEFIISFLAHLQMFIWQGDSNWRHNFAGQPAIAFPLGIFLYLGLILSVKEAILALKRKNWQVVAGHGFLLSWFFTMLLPGVLTSEGIPHQLRTIGVIPAAYIFVSLGVFKTFEFLSSRKKILSTILLIVVILAGFSDVYKYFFAWAKNNEVQGAFTAKYIKIADYLNSLPEETQKYVIVNEPGVAVPYPGGIPMPSQTIMFLERAKFGKLRAVYLKPEELDKIKTESNETIVVMMKEDNELSSKLKNMFPDVNFDF
ncbi:MAG: glycosyltransferase family 39 protein [bacterium]|nr:glycosyltransferase family 39 protein [bacterium]